MLELDIRNPIANYVWRKQHRKEGRGQLAAVWYLHHPTLPCEPQLGRDKKSALNSSVSPFYVGIDAKSMLILVLAGVTMNEYAPRPPFVVERLLWWHTSLAKNAGVATTTQHLKKSDDPNYYIYITPNYSCCRWYNYPRKGQRVITKCTGRVWRECSSSVIYYYQASYF